VESVDIQNGQIRVTFGENVTDYSDLPTLLIDAGHKLTLFREEEINLETAFMALNERDYGVRPMTGAVSSRLFANLKSRFQISDFKFPAHFPAESRSYSSYTLDARLAVGIDADQAAFDHRGQH